jgi:DNA-binding transcriptional LysR family regulator
MTMRFDVADLQLFLGVVEQGSLTRGARSMRLALASASERIAAMEEALGARLLERTSRGVRPTAAGEALVRHARIILFQVEQMRGELGGFGQGLKGRVRLLCNTAALIGYLPPRLREFLVEHPELSVDLEERPSVEIALAVAEGRADLGVAANVADLAALQSRPLIEDRLMAVLGARHRLACAAGVRFADLIGEPFIGVGDAALDIHLAERASRLGLQLDYRVRLKRMADMAMMVAAGVGIAIVSGASAADLSRDHLVIVPLEDAWAHRRLYLCARDFRRLPSAAAALAQALSPG